MEEPRTAPDAAAGEEIGLAEIVGFFRRQWLIIVACAALAVLVTVVYQGLFVHPLFMSTATLVVASPAVASEPEPGELSLQGYQRLLESGAVRAQTRYQLQEARVLESGEPFRLESRIFISQRQDTTALAPVLELVGFAGSPEKAAAVASTWAEVFIDLTRELAVSATTASAELAEGEYSGIVTSLEEIEAELLAMESDFRSELDKTANAWSRSVAAARAKTVDLVAEHQIGTRLLMTDLLDARLESSDGDLQVAPPVQAKLRQLASVRIKLAQTPPLIVLETRSTAVETGNEDTETGPLLVLERTLGDEGVPEKVTVAPARGSDSGIAQESIESIPQIDPTYSGLALRATELELELEELVTSDWRPIADLAAQLEQIQRDRLAGLDKLREERGAELAVLERKRRRELDALARTRNSEVTALRREITRLEGLAGRLAQIRNEVSLSWIEGDAGAVRIAAGAVPTGQQEPRKMFLMALLAAIGGGALGFALALLRELGAVAAVRA